MVADHGRFAASMRSRTDRAVDVAGLAGENQIGLLERLGGMARPVLDVHQRDARVGVGGRLRQHLLQHRTRLVVSAFPREHQAVEQPRVHVARRFAEMRLQHASALPRGVPTLPPRALSSGCRPGPRRTGAPRAGMTRTTRLAVRMCYDSEIIARLDHAPCMALHRWMSRCGSLMVRSGMIDHGR